MAAVQTCTVPKPSAMYSAASFHVSMPPMPEIGTRDVAPFARDVGHHVERDRLHHRPAHAAMRPLAAHMRPGRHGVEVDAHHRVDGVDEVTASAPPFTAASAGRRMLETFGVSFTITGMRVCCLHQRVTIST